MQGFNRYHPPDFDWRKTATFNEYQGKVRPSSPPSCPAAPRTPAPRLTDALPPFALDDLQHALGDRARKIDQGILIVRFELVRPASLATSLLQAPPPR